MGTIKYFISLCVDIVLWSLRILSLLQNLHFEIALKFGRDEPFFSPSVFVFQSVGQKKENNI